MLGIKDKSDLEKYAEESQSPLVKESVEKLTNLNDNVDFVYQFTPEEDEMLMNNTRIYKANKDGIEIGEARGEERNKIAVAKNLLNMNADVDFISKATGLSVNQVKEIKENM